MDHPNDSFGLFADVLAGTLGIVALIALLMVLAAGDWHITPETLHRDELRSAALPEQVAVAKRRAAKSSERLRSEVERMAPLVGVSPETLVAVAHAEAVAKSNRPSPVPLAVGANPAMLRRENLRLGQKVADLVVMNDALDVMVANLRDRPHPRETAQLVEPAVPLRVLREGRETPKPFYLICRAGKIYAPYIFSNGVLQPNRGDLSWIILPGGKTTRCLPIPNRGWTLEEMGERMNSFAPELARRPDFYAVILAFPDSFAEAREVLRLLDTANLPFSWRPYPASESVDFAVDGAIPPPPL
jgi:hypothetical protein